MSRVLPILFNTDMVRAILDGRKTVTRRVIKQEKILDVLSSPARIKNPDIPDEKFISCLIDIPYEPGDILYVRETYKRNMDGYSEIDFGGYIYRADCKQIFKDSYNPWRPSIHMPKEAARIWLKVTEVGVERLQDMTPLDLDDEGVGQKCVGISVCGGGCDDCGGTYDNKKLIFRELWNSTIKKPDLALYGWNANPWVWVIEFERCDKPQEGYEAINRRGTRVQLHGAAGVKLGGELKEEAAECIENCYGKETELTAAIRQQIK